VQRDLDRLDGGVFDLLVVGGGITGAGVALDAASRGLRVALADKGDFASGTSSASSKLVHGGLRYLELGHFRLVGEALTERRRLLHNAPHLARPLRFVLPAYRDGRLPLWKARAGLLAYDWLAGRDNLRPSRQLTAARLAREFPALRTRGLVGGADYSDAAMDDARLALAVVRSAAARGAVAANYLEVIAFTRDAAGRLDGAVLRDRAPGSAGRELRLKARALLNAAGPWSDGVTALAAAATGADLAGPRLEPTKGVHVVLPDVGLTAAFLLFHPADGRVFFAIPWERRTLVGTTDTFATARPDALPVLPAEVAYLLDGFNAHFAPGFRASDVLGAFAGLRPLLRADAGGPSARSREFALLDGPGGLLTAAGGKYTTYRHMAEQATDAVVRRLGGRARCRTYGLRLDGAPPGDWADYAARETRRLADAGLAPGAAAHLVGRYGTRAVEAAAYVRADRDGLRPVAAGEPDLRGEWAYQRAAEMALTPADHLLRRSRLGLVRPDVLAAYADAPHAGAAGA
jgi:glycerol-3-phosphate dehydrogenase